MPGVEVPLPGAETLGTASTRFSPPPSPPSSLLLLAPSLLRGQGGGFGKNFPGRRLGTKSCGGWLLIGRRPRVWSGWMAGDDSGGVARIHECQHLVRRGGSHAGPCELAARLAGVRVGQKGERGGERYDSRAPVVSGCRWMWLVGWPAGPRRLDGPRDPADRW
jgi:hypothetical protein